MKVLIPLFVYVVFVFALLSLGAFCVNYDLGVTLHKHLPLFWAYVVTLFTGDLSVLLAIVLKILKLLGVI